MTTEIWKPILGYHGYEASSLGRIAKVKNGKRRIKKQTTTGRRYAATGITSNGKQEVRNVHEWVALAFLGPRPDGVYVCHNNSDPFDNRPENLRYDKPEGNMKDAMIAESLPGSKLTMEQVLMIRHAVAAGKNGRERRAIKRDLAYEFGVTWCAIHNIVIGRTWRHVGGPRITSQSLYVGRSRKEAMRVNGIGKQLAFSIFAGQPEAAS